MWAIVALTFAITGADSGGDPGLFTRVRSTQHFMIALSREGYDRSPAFRDLVDTLQRSNVIVFVQPAACAGGRIRSCLVSVNGSDGARHIRIHVDPHTSRDRLIATVAHELQHAVEIAGHPDIVMHPLCSDYIGRLPSGVVATVCRRSARRHRRWIQSDWFPFNCLRRSKNPERGGPWKRRLRHSPFR
jgi:hypothetical protein